MEILVKETGTVHTTYVVKDGDRMAVLVMQGQQLEHAETVGCFDHSAAESFVQEATVWLAQQPSARRANRSGEYVAIRLDGATLRATG